MPPTEPEPLSQSPAAILHDPYAAVRSPNFRRYWSGNFISILGTQMQTATIVWEVFRRTKIRSWWGWSIW